MGPLETLSGCVWWAIVVGSEEEKAREGGAQGRVSRRRE